MQITVLEQDKNKIKFTLEGAGHTFCNNLKKELNNDNNILSAAYRIDHPLIGTPTFIIEKKGTGTFKKILSDAAGRIKKNNKIFETAFNKMK